MNEKKNLLDKYYSGQTSLEEEKAMKAMFEEEAGDFSEADIFSFYKAESKVAEGLEADMFAGIETHVTKKNFKRRRLYSAISAAAVVLVVVSVFLNVRSNRKAQMLEDFMVMEQALLQVSESLQPDPEPEEMLVLWVDDDVEIILN